MKCSPKERGGALVFALITSIILMAMVGSLAMVAAKESEMVIGTRQLEQARFIAEAGLNLALEDYQKDQLPPPKDWYDNPQPFGEGTFQIISDAPLGGSTQRRLVQIEAVFDGAEWRIEAVIGPESRPLFDSAVQANFDITMDNNGEVDSYDSRVGPYDPKSPSESGDVKGNGNIKMTNSAAINGDVEVIGTITLEGSASVSGSQTEGGDGVFLPSTDPLIDKMVAELSASNDNASLDPSLVEIKDGQPMIHLQSNRTKVISSGDYYLHSIIIENQSNLVFDTSGGPVRVVVHSEDVFLKNNTEIVVSGANPVYFYLAGDTKFFMDNHAWVTNPLDRADLFQVVMSSNGGGEFTRLKVANNTKYYGTFWAPGADIILENNFDLFGAVICREILAKNYAKVHYDEALADGLWLLVPDSYRVHFKRRVV